MLNYFDVAALKAGDKVGFARFHHWGGTMLQGGITTVFKVNGYGHITLENMRVFDKHGNERNAVGCGCRLYPVEAIEAYKVAEQNRRELNATYKELLDMFVMKTTGSGHFTGLTLTEKDAAIALIKRM